MWGKGQQARGSEMAVCSGQWWWGKPGAWRRAKHLPTQVDLGCAPETPAVDLRDISDSSCSFNCGLSAWWLFCDAD